jgi:hypothetical protein
LSAAVERGHDCSVCSSVATQSGQEAAESLSTGIE